MQPYEGMGQHFLQRKIFKGALEVIGADSLGGRALTWLQDSALNVVSGRGLLKGEFYELHSQLHGGAAFGRRTAQGMSLIRGEPWKASKVMPALQAYGHLGYLWFGSPPLLKLFAAEFGYTAARSATSTH
jgi:hypothetical protein